MVGAAVWKVRVATGDSKSTEKKKKKTSREGGFWSAGWWLETYSKASLQ